jgi:hypothetical protein
MDVGVSDGVDEQKYYWTQSIVLRVLEGIAIKRIRVPGVLP